MLQHSRTAAGKTFLLDPRKDDLTDEDVLRSMNNALLLWTPSEDLVVTELLGRGGNSFVFRCEVKRAPLYLRGKNGGDCSVEDLVRKCRHPAIKVISSDCVRNETFESDSLREFRRSRIMEDYGYGPPVYCWGSFALKGARNSAYPPPSPPQQRCSLRRASSPGGGGERRRRRGATSTDVVYFLIFMEEMRSSLAGYAGIGTFSDVRQAWADAVALLGKASVEERIVFADAKPENFLVKTLAREKNKRSSTLDRVYLSDFDEQFLHIAQSSDDALLLNMILFSTALLFHTGNFAREYRSGDGLASLLPDELLLFISDMCRSYCASPKTIAFLARDRRYLSAALQYSRTTTTTAAQSKRRADMSTPPQRQIESSTTMRRFLSNYRRRAWLLFDACTDAGRQARCDGELQKLADRAFLESERRESYAAIDFRKEAAAAAWETRK